MNRLRKLKIIYYVIILVVVCLGFYLISKLGAEKNDVLNVLGQDIYFAYTDDNTGEDLIIKSDKKDYEGFNQSTVYFNLTNTKRRTELIDLQVLFNNGSGSVANIDKWDKQKRDWVSLEEEKLVLVEETGVPMEQSGVPSLLGDSPQQAEDSKSFFSKLFSRFFGRLKRPQNDKLALTDLQPKSRTQYLIESKETAYFRMAINYPPMSQGEFFIQAKGNKGGYGLLDPWYNSSWSYRKKITIDKDKIMTDAVDFPVLATTTDSDLKFTGSGGHVASSTAGDIVFTDSTGTILNYEIEKYASTTGELVSWVQTDISSTTDTILYMYYGNAGNTTVLATTTGVWDSNYKGVWHLAHDGVATTTYPDFLDSTSNNNDGSSKNMVGDISNLVSTSTIDGGVGFDGDSTSGAYIDLPNMDIVAGGSGDDGLTIQFWFNADDYASPADTRFISKADGSNEGDHWWMVSISGTKLRARLKTDGTTTSHISSDTLSTGTWYYGVVTYDGSRIKIYRDGLVKLDDAKTGTISTDASIGVEIARNPDGYGEFDGTIDEMRILNIARSAQWIKTEYNNQVNVGSFMSFGPEQTDDWYNSDWHFRKKITISNSQVTTNAADFPVLATTTDTDLRDKAMNGGQDILFTSDDGLTKIPHEIEKFSKNTGELVAWVKTDLSSTTDQTLYMYYGNYQATSQASTTAVWDSNYKGVWHLAHDGVATTTYPDFLDSTSNDNDGSSKGMTGDISNLISTSTIDGGVGFDGSDEYVEVGSPSSLNLTGEMSLFGWVKFDDVISTQYFLSEADSGGNTYQYSLGIGYGDNELDLWWGNAEIDYSSSNLQTGQWYFIGFTRSGSTGSWTSKIYVDGNLDETRTGISTNPGSQSSFSIGRAGDHNDFYFDGIIDEARISNIARSGDWIKTEYNNQVSVGNFMTLAGETRAPDYPETDKDWYNTSWKFRKKISIDADQVAADLDDFPVLLNYHDSRLIDKARDDGYDIVFTNSTGTTTLQFEREKFATSTGELVYWVKTDVSSTTDTILYMYYGNSNQSTDLATTTGVWDDNFKGVWHLHNTASSTDSITDSTKNDNDGTPTSPMASSTAQIDGGLEFDGDDDYVDVGNASSGIKTVSFWINTDQNYSKKVIDIDGTDQIELDNDGDVAATSFPAATVYVDGKVASAVSTSTWQFVAVTDTTGVNASDMDIGRVSTGYFDGRLDEVRVSNTVRSAQWIKTEYNNQFSPTTFARFDVEEQYNRTTQINASLVNFATGGLVGHWTFNGEDMDWSSSTAEVLDRSGNSNNGNVTNFDQTSVTPGISGQALDFERDSGDEIIVITDSSSLSSLDLFTISAWINMESKNAADEMTIVGHWDEFLLNIDSGATEELSIDLGDGSHTNSNSLVPTGEWAHVAVTVDITSGGDFYINGVNDGSHSETRASDDGSGAITIGARSLAGYNQFFDGIIDEVRIYNRVLSADEILDLYQVGARRLQPDAPLTQFQTGGLVGHWTFNGPDMDWGANKATDRSGQGNDGTITNMSTSTSPAIGISGQALEFDGGDDYVGMAISPSLNNNLTYSAWIKLNSVDSNYHLIVGKGGASPPADIDGKMYISGASGEQGKLSIYTRNAASTEAFGTTVLSANIWYHAAVVVSGTTARVYLNGIEENSGTTVSRPSATSARPITIGIDGGPEPPSGQNFNGLIDEVRVYNRALGADEILDLYQAGSRRFRPN